MSYVDRNYFDNSGIDPRASDAMSTEEFDMLSAAASDIVNDVTLGRINILEFDSLPSYTKDKVEKATCYEISFLYNNGGLSALSGRPTGDVDSFTLGRYQRKKGGSSKVKVNADGLPLSPMLRVMLNDTNLLYRGATVGLEDLV